MFQWTEVSVLTLRSVPAAAHTFKSRRRSKGPALRVRLPAKQHLRLHLFAPDEGMSMKKSQ